MHRCKQINTDDVQFDFYNTTGSPIALDLFSLLGPIIPDNPALTPPNTITNSVGGGTQQTLVNELRNEVYVPDGPISDNVYVLNANDGSLKGFAFGLVPGSDPRDVALDTINNQLFISCTGTQRVAVFDLSTPIPTFVTDILLPNDPGEIVYNPTLQKLYCIRAGFNTQVIDANTNTLITNIPNPNNAQDGVFCSVQNQVYTFSITGSFRIIDCTTDTLTGVLLNIPATTSSAVYNSPTNEIYVVGTDFYAIDCSTNLPTANFSLAPGFAGGGGIGFDTNANLVYCFDATSDLVRVVDINTFTIVNSFNSGVNPGVFIEVGFSPTNNFFYIPSQLANTTSTLSTTGVPTNSVYYTGTSDYNAFVRDLQDNPIRVAEIRILANNQNQFDNPLNVKITDANGVSSDHPRFPFIDLRIFQFQSRLVVLEFDKVPLIFNGREFFSQYILNPNEKVIFVIKYWQKWKKCITENDFYNPTIYRFNDIK
jgi:hypothetical protein